MVLQCDFMMGGYFYGLNVKCPTKALVFEYVSPAGSYALEGCGDQMANTSLELKDCDPPQLWPENVA